MHADPLVVLRDRRDQGTKGSRPNSRRTVQKRERGILPHRSRKPRPPPSQLRSSSLLAGTQGATEPSECVLLPDLAPVCRRAPCDLLLDPGVRLRLSESTSRPDLSGKQLPRLHVQPPLTFRELRRTAFPPQRPSAAHPVPHDLRKLERIAARQLRLSLPQACAPTAPAGFAPLMQPLLDAHICFADQRAQPFTCPLNRQRDPQAAGELEHDDFPRDAENRSLLACCHPTDPMRGIDNGVADGELHTTRVAAAASSSLRGARAGLLDDGSANAARMSVRSAPSREPVAFPHPPP